jgi:hypothetical protein
MTQTAADRAPGTATLEAPTRLLALALVVLAVALVLAGCTATTASSSAPTPQADVKPSALALQQQFVKVVKQVGPWLVGSFPADDLAVLHIDAGGLQPAAFADSSHLQVGDVALAIGNVALAIGNPLALGAWNSIVAGLLALALAGSVLVAGRGRKGCSASAGREHRPQPEAPDGRR